MHPAIWLVLSAVWIFLSPTTVTVTAWNSMGEIAVLVDFYEWTTANCKPVPILHFHRQLINAVLSLGRIWSQFFTTLTFQPASNIYVSHGPIISNSICVLEMTLYMYGSYRVKWFKQWSYMYNNIPFWFLTNDSQNKALTFVPSQKSKAWAIIRQ